MQQERPQRPRIDPMTLGRRIVKRRSELQMEQGTLAILSTLSRAYISRLENGLVANPKLFDLEQVARVLDLPLVELVSPEETLIETRFSSDWEQLQRQVADLPPEQAERVLRGFWQSVEIARAADLARRN